jgi:polar amino acid transport system substrate-binding protein
VATGVDFVDYLTGRTAVLVRAGNPSHVGGPGDLCGRTVAVAAGTAQQGSAARLDAACRSKGRSPLSAQVVADHDALVAAIAGGRAAAALDDAVVAAYTAQVSTGAQQLQLAGTPVDPVPYGIGVLRSDPQLRDALRAALAGAVADGEYDQALARWGGQDAAWRTPTVDAGT